MKIKASQALTCSPVFFMVILPSSHLVQDIIHVERTPLSLMALWLITIGHFIQATTPASALPVRQGHRTHRHLQDDWHAVISGTS